MVSPASGSVQADLDGAAGGGHNGTPMSHNGSGSIGEPALHPGIALGAAVVGTLAMLLGGRAVVGLLPLRAVITVGSVLLALPALLALFAARLPLARTLALRPVERPVALWSAALGLSLWVASLGLLELQYTVWSPPAGYLEAFRRIHEALRPEGPLDAVLSVLAIAAAPAVFEEALVRGVMLPSFRPWLGATGAVVASATAFALLHLDPYRFAFTFAVGVALGAVRLWAGALVPCMLAHGTLNTLTFLAAPLVDDPSGPLPEPEPLLGAALFAGGLAVTVLLFRLLRRQE